MNFKSIDLSLCTNSQLRPAVGRKTGLKWLLWPEFIKKSFSIMYLQFIVLNVTRCAILYYPVNVHLMFHPATKFLIDTQIYIISILSMGTTASVEYKQYNALKYCEYFTLVITFILGVMQYCTYERCETLLNIFSKRVPRS